MPATVASHSLSPPLLLLHLSLALALIAMIPTSPLSLSLACIDAVHHLARVCSGPASGKQHFIVPLLCIPALLFPGMVMPLHLFETADKLVLQRALEVRKSGSPVLFL